MWYYLHRLLYWGNVMESKNCGVIYKNIKLKQNDAPKAPAKIVFIKKAQKNFLIKFNVLNPDIKMCKISLFDMANLTMPVSYIEYQLHKDCAIICHFKTDFDYQGLGIGKFIYMIAQAHADMLNLTRSEGIISPIGKIKGVVSQNEYHSEKELDFLTLLYHALGNKIKKIEDGDLVMYVFNDNWEHGKKYEKLNTEQKSFVDDVFKYEYKSRNLNCQKQTAK